MKIEYHPDIIHLLPLVQLRAVPQPAHELTGGGCVWILALGWFCHSVTIDLTFQR